MITKPAAWKGSRITTTGRRKDLAPKRISSSSNNSELVASSRTALNSGSLESKTQKKSHQLNKWKLENWKKKRETYLGFPLKLILKHEELNYLRAIWKIVRSEVSSEFGGKYEIWKGRTWNRRRCTRVRAKRESGVWSRDDGGWPLVMLSHSSFTLSSSAHSLAQPCELLAPVWGPLLALIFS